MGTSHPADDFTSMVAGPLVGSPLATADVTHWGRVGKVENFMSLTFAILAPCALAKTAQQANRRTAINFVWIVCRFIGMPPGGTCYAPVVPESTCGEQCADLFPIPTHNVFCAQMAASRQQFQSYSRLPSESADRPPWNIRIVFSVK